MATGALSEKFNIRVSLFIKLSFTGKGLKTEDLQSNLEAIVLEGWNSSTSFKKFVYTSV